MLSVPMLIWPACLHHDAEVKAVWQLSRRRWPAEWVKMAAERDHYKLAFNSPGHLESKVQPRLGQAARLTISSHPAFENQKSPSTRRSSTATVCPSTAVRTYTKSDWTLWTATLAEKQVGLRCDCRPGLQVVHRNNEPRPHDRLVRHHHRQAGKLPGPQCRRRPLRSSALDDKSLAAKWRARSVSSSQLSSH